MIWAPSADDIRAGYLLRMRAENGPAQASPTVVGYARPVIRPSTTLVVWGEAAPDTAANEEGVRCLCAG